MTRSRLLFDLSLRAVRRNPGPTVVLLLFTALAAMLAGAAASLLTEGSTATAALMERARTPHFLQMHAGELDRMRLEQFAAAQPAVDQFGLSAMLNVDGTAVTVGEHNLAGGLQDNSFVVQNPDFDFLLDQDSQVIQPEPGTVWLPLYYRDLLGLEAGQTVTVTGPAGSLSLELAGFLRDSQMNSSYASSKRLLVHETDLAELRGLMGPAGITEYLIQFRLHDTADIAAFESAYREAGLEANGPTITWQLFTLINSLTAGISAVITVLVTLLLVGIALLAVRFTLLTTLAQDHREIGVLKALGVRNADLRSLYGSRYLLLASLGVTVGLLAAGPLSRLLLQPVETYMGLSGGNPLTLPLMLLAGAVITGIIMFGVRSALRRLDRLPAVQAIRTGTPQAQGAIRRVPSLLSAGPDVNVRLGLRDVLNRPAGYAVPFLIFTLAAFILTVPQNLYSTVTQPEFITYMGAGVSDMRIDYQPVTAQRLQELDQALAADSRVDRHTVLTTASYLTTDPTGRTVNLNVESGDQQAFPISYLEGRAPAAQGELALSKLLADSLGAEPGSSLTIDPVTGTEPLQLTVTGVYQDLTNGGRTARMTTGHSSSELMWATVYADLVPGSDADTVSAEYAAGWPDLKVSSVSSYVAATMGGTIDTLRTASVAALFIGLAVAALITALFIPLLLSRDAFSTAVLRSLGFRTSHIRLQYVTRALTVLIPGIVLGAVLANVLGGSLAGLLLSPVGLSRLTLVANPLQAWLLTPLALLAVVIAVTLLSSRPGRGAAIPMTLKELT